MRRILAATLLALTLLPSATRADVAAAIRDDILPGYAGFSAATGALAEAAAASCDPALLQPAFHAAYDAWLQIGFLHLGPTEEDGRGLAILFWPDPKGLGAKAQRGLLLGDPAALEPAAFADQSVAARGLAGLERLLYPRSAPEADPCPLIRATATDLHRMATEVEAGWQGADGFGDLLRNPGAPGNSRYLTPTEAKQALFTQLATGFVFVADQRIGRPLGSFDRPRPERAEARASGRSQRNVTVTLQALRRFALVLAPDAVETAAAIDTAIQLSQALGDPSFDRITDPQAWMRLQGLQQAVRAARETAISEIGQILDVSVGFNAQDGD